MNLVSEPIELYAAAHSDPVPPLLDELREETYATMSFPQMQVGRIEGALLKMLVRLARSPHGKKIDVRMGPALDTICNLAPPLDLVFIDADKANYARYYDAALPLLRPGGLIVADNALWSGSVLDPKTDDARAIAAFNDKIAADDRVEKVLLTVRDGMLFARKR